MDCIWQIHQGKGCWTQSVPSHTVSWSQTQRRKKSCSCGICWWQVTLEGNCRRLCSVLRYRQRGRCLSPMWRIRHRMTRCRIQPVPCHTVSWSQMRSSRHRRCCPAHWVLSLRSHHCHLRTGCNRSYRIRWRKRNRRRCRWGRLDWVRPVLLSFSFTNHDDGVKDASNGPIQETNAGVESQFALVARGPETLLDQQSVAVECR
jgi:hypothetical protein